MNQTNTNNSKLDRLCSDFSSIEISEIQRKYDNGVYFNSNCTETNNVISDDMNNKDDHDLFWCIQCNNFTQTEITSSIPQDKQCKICQNIGNKQCNLWSQCVSCQHLYCFDCTLTPKNYKFMKYNQSQNDQDTDQDIDLNFNCSRSTKPSIPNNPKKRSIKSNHNINRPCKRRKINEI